LGFENPGINACWYHQLGEKHFQRGTGGNAQGKKEKGFKEAQS
jgi:hypothetical protein